MHDHTKSFTIGILSLLAFLFISSACTSPPSDVSTTSNAASTPTVQSYVTSTNSSVAGNQTSSAEAALPLRHLHMVDRLNGWALTKSAMLRTYDGGQHWKDVTLRGSGGSAMDAGANALPVFQSASRAWVFEPIPHSGSGVDVVVWRTNDSGQSWQRSELTTAGEMSFISILDGWIVNSNSPVLYHTADGGYTWSKITYSIK